MDANLHFYFNNRCSNNNKIFFRIKYEKGTEDDLNGVFSLPLFHEYTNKGTDSKSADKMIVYSFIGACNTDK